VSAGGSANPTISAPEIPEFVSDLAENPRVPAPIRMLGPVQRTLFTHDEGTSAGWLKNCGILGAGTVGQGAETMGSYSRSVRFLTHGVVVPWAFPWRGLGR